MIRTHGAKKGEVPNVRLVEPSVLRLQKDLDTLDLPSQCQLSFPDPANKTKFVVSICPDEGLYRGGQFRFSVTVPSTYPHDPPKVRCLQTIFHPNIDTNGSVCLNVLGVGWNPVMTIYSVIIGLLDLFYNPQVDDPLNKDAAQLLQNNSDAFARKVRLTMRGLAGDSTTTYSDTLF